MKTEKLSVDDDDEDEVDDPDYQPIPHHLLPSPSSSTLSGFTSASHQDLSSRLSNNKNLSFHQRSASVASFESDSTSYRRSSTCLSPSIFESKPQLQTPLLLNPSTEFTTHSIKPSEISSNLNPRRRLANQIKKDPKLVQEALDDGRAMVFKFGPIPFSIGLERLYSFCISLADRPYRLPYPSFVDRGEVGTLEGKIGILGYILPSSSEASEATEEAEAEEEVDELLIKIHGAITSLNQLQHNLLSLQRLIEIGSLRDSKLEDDEKPLRWGLICGGYLNRSELKLFGPVRFSNPNHDHQSLEIKRFERCVNPKTGEAMLPSSSLRFSNSDSQIQAHQKRKRDHEGLIQRKKQILMMVKDKERSFYQTQECEKRLSDAKEILKNRSHRLTPSQRRSERILKSKR